MSSISENGTMLALKRRLDSAENDTKQLTDQLTKIGFPPAAVNKMHHYSALLKNQPLFLYYPGIEYNLPLF